MIAKELNAAFSDEKQREQWLKRILPALVVTVIYFVFISKTLVDKADKAESAYRAMVMKGISEAALPGLQQQTSAVQQALATLTQQHDELQASLAAKAGFLYGSNDMNEAVSKIAILMQRHRLRISEEKSLGPKKLAELPQAFADLKKWLGDMLKAGDEVHVHRITFIGGYVDVYEALAEMAASDIKALPLYLSMKNPDENRSEDTGLKAWTLDLWM